MFRNIFHLILLLCFIEAQANDDAWTAFWDKDNYKYGFKDKNGAIKIPPKFMGMSQAIEFKNIIAVMEEKDGNYDAYYLLKNGERVKNVKMFIFDNSFDCESENKIRFRDEKTDSMGYLDGYGNIAIPAMYSIGQPFANGLASVLKGASLTCMNGKPFSVNNRCEHPHWKGGVSLVINTNNDTVIQGLSLESELDRYSLTISHEPSKSKEIESFKGLNGKYYNFINTKKHFEIWFNENILGDLSDVSLRTHTFEQVTLFDREKGWYKQPGQKFWKNNYEAVRKTLSYLKNNTSSFFVSMDSLNSGIYEEEQYKAYYAQCYNQYANKHPTLSVIAGREFEGSYVQDVFEFLKIKDTYKLISMTLRTSKLE